MEQDSVLVAALIVIAGFVSLEVGVSTAILEILAGVVGANILNLHTTQWLDFLADFGLIGIMFFAGFETDPNVLKKNLVNNTLLGTLSYVVPFIFVFITVFFFFGFNFQASILVGISMSTTSLALVYAVLREKNMAAGEAGQIMLGSAMIADILSMLSLTILIGEYGIYTLVYSISLIVLLYLSPRIGKIVFKRYKGNVAELEIKFILLMLLVMPFFSEHVGISEAVFAFLLGVLFSEMLEEDQIVEEKLRGIIFGFLAPAFFFKAGLLIDIGAFDYYVITLIVVLGFLAFFTKYFSVLFPAQRFMKKETSKLMGLFFNFRLSFGIVAALFGLENGFIAEEVYIAILTIILLSSVVSSILLKVIPHETYTPPEDQIETAFHIT